MSLNNLLFLFFFFVAHYNFILIYCFKINLLLLILSFSREINAVNLEHERNIPSDLWRVSQVEKSLSDPSHAYHKFGTGNTSTLKTIPAEKGIDVRKALLDFHEKYYSSNIMALTVLDKASLDDLQAMVLTMFNDVQNKDIAVPSWPDHPYNVSSFKNKKKMLDSVFLWIQPCLVSLS